MRFRVATAVAVVAAALLTAGAAAAGSTTGFGSTRVASLADSVNAVSVTIACPETMSGFAGFTYEFTFNRSSPTEAMTYRLAVVVSPGRDVEARWNGSAALLPGAGSATARVVIPPDALPFTAPNTPFRIELRFANGSLADSVDFSVDLRYREPPPDGGLLALALASASVWGVVFLYTLNLHLAQRKLRARADALEHAQNNSAAGVSAGGKQP